MGDQKEDVHYEPVRSEDGDLEEDGDKLEINHNEEKLQIEEEEEETNRKFLYWIACAANLTVFTCGLTFGWTSPIIPKLNGNIDPNNNPLPSPATPGEESWIGSLLPVGATFGPLAAGMYVDKLGRKKTIMVSVLPFIVAFIMFAFGSNVNMFFLGRFLCGLSVGAMFTVIPIYIAEISDDAVRGSLGSLLQLFVTLGLLVSYVIGPYVPISIFNLGCVVVPVAFLIICAVYMPESPYFSIAQKDEATARETLQKIRSKSSSGVQKELMEIKETVEDSLANKATFFDIFKSEGLKKALILSVGLVSLQQFSGINVILFYTQTIFAATGSDIPADISTIIIGIVQVLASFITPAFVDKKGKRFLLLFSAVGMAISEAVLGYYFYVKDKGNDVQGIFWLPILCLVVYMITYCSGFGPLPWAVMGELFPGNVKSVASTATASACWALAFVITKFFGNVAEVIGNAGSFWVFAVCCALGAVFVYKYLPETTGKSLQEIQDILNGKDETEK